MLALRGARGRPDHKLVTGKARLEEERTTSYLQNAMIGDQDKALMFTRLTTEPRMTLRFSPNSGLSRRAMLAAGLGLGLVAPVLAQQQPATAPIKDVMQAGPLGDRILGKADAPVTIVEYASFTCPHCASFHTETLPKLKEKYIDSGKVRLIFREFPFDPMATAISMITRCAPEQRYFPLADLYFRQLDALRASQKPLDDLLATARQAGFTQESFEACLKNQSVYDGVNAVKKHGADVLGVNSTPTFFINGQRVNGARSIEEMDKLIEPLLPK